MASKFSIEAIFKGIDKITAPVSRMSNSVGKFARSAKANLVSIGNSVNNLSKKFSKVLAVSATAGFLALNLAAKDAVVTGMQFEQTIVSAAAKFPGEIKKGTKEFELLEAAAKKTGKETEFTATQSAEAINFLAMAGFNAQMSIAALPGVVDLATAASIDLARATDIATDTLGAFGLATEDPIKLSKNLARVNDVLAKTTTTANTNMEQLFEAIAEGGPVAKSAGASIETFTTLAGKLANAGIKGGEAGTTLKNVFLRLAAPVGGAAKMLKRMGVATKDNEGNLRDVIDILGDLEKGVKKFGTAEQAAILEEIFGKIPIAGVNVLLGTGAEKLKEYRKQLEAATGSSNKMASTMRDTLQGRVNSLKSAFEGLQLTIFGLEKGPFSDFVEKITETVRTIDSAISTNQDLAQSFVSDINNVLSGSIKIIGMFIAAMIALKGIILFTNAAIIVFKTTMFAVKAAMLLFQGVLVVAKVAMFALNAVMMANPLLAISIAIAALIIGITLLVKNWETVKAVVSDVWDSITAKVKDSIDAILNFISGVTTPFKDLFSGISGIGEKFSFLFGKPEEEKKGGEAKKPEMTTKEERISTAINEKVTEKSSTLLIKDETGRAELSTPTGNGSKIRLATSGGF